MATAFTLGDMAPDLAAGTPFEANLLFRGGGGSAEGGALMLHPYADLPGARPVGASGLYVGGFAAATARAAAGELPADRFKFFFNQCEWRPGQLERECAAGLWRVGAAPARLCLRQAAAQPERWTAAPRRPLGPDGAEESLWGILRRGMGLAADDDAIAQARAARAGARAGLLQEDGERAGGRAWLRSKGVGARARVAKGWRACVRAWCRQRRRASEKGGGG
jgi:hypothetical protein